MQIFFTRSFQLFQLRKTEYKNKQTKSLSNNKMETEDHLSGSKNNFKSSKNIFVVDDLLSKA
jgi:adenine/guanine phosphoribosyltransferase-like PRPP-binding protein